MRRMRKLYIASGIILGIFILSYIGCSSTSKLARNTSTTDTLYTNPEAEGDLLEISFERGSEHNHPLMAIWVEDMEGRFLQTLFVAESIGKGVFGHGDKSTGKWLPGPIRRPAALPVWSHRRGVQEEDGLYVPTKDTPVPDAYTGATPPAHFSLYARTDNPLPDTFVVYFEINQTWDWNEYWTNNKYPDNEDYKTSCQPALVYRAVLITEDKGTVKPLELIGHSHYAGSNGEITSDLSTITTAKDITRSVSVKLH